MLYRYLGNKTDLLDPILEVVKSSCEPGDLVCDIFSGSMAVSMALKLNGFLVAANDINLFSSIIGEALITSNEIPDVHIKDLLPNNKYREFIAEAEVWSNSLCGVSGFSFLKSKYQYTKNIRYLALLLYLQKISSDDIPKSWLRSDIYDIYTEQGKKSQYISSRGRVGRRRFFIPENGHKIDCILSILRYWWRNHIISKILYVNLLCSLIRAIEKVSNTQGTYHDFPRDEYDDRSLHLLSFEATPFDIALKGGKHLIGCEEDSLEFIKRVPEHALIYIDPPYNFRQYTSYYFFPNIVCRYCDINDLDNYFSKIQYVRGQNMSDDFISSFCKKAQFIDSLKLLISRANTHFVVLSYFSGKNHWSDFKGNTNDQGYNELSELFKSDLFYPGSFKVLPLERTNYQSYGGYQAAKILEYLFIAEKRR